MVYSPSQKGAFLKTAVCPKRTELLHYVKETYGQEGRCSGGLRSHPSAAHAVIFTLYPQSSEALSHNAKVNVVESKAKSRRYAVFGNKPCSRCFIKYRRKKIKSVKKKAGMMGLPKAFLIENEYFETTLTYLPHFQPLKQVNSRFIINPVVIRCSH